MTDRELLSAYVNDHDRVAMTELVRRHGPLVLGVAQRTGREADAGVILQGVFLGLIDGPAPRRPGSLAAELHASALAASRQRPASKVRKGGVDPGLSALDPALARLPEESRAAVIAATIQDQPEIEAAAALDVAPSRFRRLRDGGLNELNRRLAGDASALLAAARAATPPPLRSQVEPLLAAAKLGPRPHVDDRLGVGIDPIALGLAPPPRRVSHRRPALIALAASLLLGVVLAWSWARGADLPVASEPRAFALAPDAPPPPVAQPDPAPPAAPEPEAVAEVQPEADPAPAEEPARAFNPVAEAQKKEQEEKIAQDEDLRKRQDQAAERRQRRERQFAGAREAHQRAMARMFEGMFERDPFAGRPEPPFGFGFRRPMMPNFDDFDVPAGGGDFTGTIVINGKVQTFDDPKKFAEAQREMFGR